MAKTRYTATDANGVIHTRNSDRVYTHTVVYLNDYDAALAGAHTKSWAQLDRSNFEYYQKLVSGNHSYTHVSEKEIASAKEKLEATPTVELYLAAELAARVARIEANKANGYYKQYFNAGWCGRLDLAQKLVSKYQYGEILSVTAS
jgi:hypothetical protein